MKFFPLNFSISFSSVNFLECSCVNSSFISHILYLCMSVAFLFSGQSSTKIEELLQEDQNVKRKRERYTKQSSILSKLVRQLSIHDNRADAASGWSDGGSGAGNAYHLLEYSSPYCVHLPNGSSTTCLLFPNSY